MESAMTTWTAVASSVADQGRKLAAAAGPACSTAAETGRQACSCAAEVGRQAGTVAWKLTRSTGKAAWIAGTSFLVLVAPLMILTDREAAFNENENAWTEYQTLLGPPSW
ncbi:hypothetical protein VPH35_068143 [Triticum aestivum]|uniref:Mitochondrial import receptor subunit TOM22 homolog n=1 Tax=Triticum turgidum subsp. durum TaxID=4567 RepID=A0A9R0SLS0_TRITD|nr:mitochondrial import receptor subunit TOM9-2-like [Triticum aestivum]VAH96741.1 unnamed protein product [Triticum turgidum subsp. durum]